MLTAINVGAIGVYSMASYGWVSLHNQALLSWAAYSAAASSSGGAGDPRLIVGHHVAACGRGPSRCDGGVFGLLLGASIYVAAWPLLRRLIEWAITAGQLPQVTGNPEWFWIMARVFGVGSLGHRRGRSTRNQVHPSDAATPPPTHT